MIDWNNRFPLDAAYRKKFNIAFGSEEHRNVSQIDVYLDWLEGELYDEFLQKAKQELKDAEEYKKGSWLKDRISEDDSKVWDLFNRLNVSNINNDQPLVVNE